jgi:hypothetical protein
MCCPSFPDRQGEDILGATAAVTTPITVRDLIATGLQKQGPAYRCFICDDRIAENGHRYDAGPGRRAHKSCVDEFADVFSPDATLRAASSSRALVQEQKRLKAQLTTADFVRQLYCDTIAGRKR